MLEKLYVKNLVLIDEAEVEFSEGLNILTGETGAGKSLLLGSVNLALGGKASKDLIRADADYALVELTFSITDKNVLEVLKAMDLIFEQEGQILISRKIINGRSISRVNGETVSAAELKKITELLLDIHGQHEHQSLLYKSRHLEILDEFAGQEAREAKKQLSEAYDSYRAFDKQRKGFLMDEEQRLRECAFLQFEIDEIEHAGLKEGEEEELAAWYKKAVNSKKLIETIGKIYEQLHGDSMASAGELVGASVKELSGMTEYDEGLFPVLEQLETVDSMLSDAARELSSYLTDLEFDEETFLDTESRLNLIHRMEEKYGKSIPDILEYQKEKTERLLLLNHYQEEREKAEALTKKAREKAEKLAKALSQIRKKSAKGLKEQIKNALTDLNFLEVKFEIQIEEENLTKNGIDSAEFLISTNPGEELRPLSKVVSGGELSRIMLAIKTVLSDKDSVDTLIFDEIDVGISGITAQMVARKLSQIAKRRQVLCITHLAQIAAAATSHYVIEKKVVNKKTVTRIHGLTEEESIQELARIVGGAQITETVRRSAREMKDLAKRTK